MRGKFRALRGKLGQHQNIYNLDRARQIRPETKPQEIFKNEGPPPIRNVRGEQKQNKTN